MLLKCAFRIMGFFGVRMQACGNIFSVDLAKEETALNGSLEDKTSQGEASEVTEPFVGMEFDSEDDAKKFYVEYARQVGFVVRVMQRRRSGIDGKTLARRLGCNKQGFSANQKLALAPEKKPRCSAREGCKATILVKMEKSGKWVVTRFVKEHNHPLVLISDGFNKEDDKDQRIEGLRQAVELQEQLCSAYREKLLTLMKEVEEHSEELTSKVQVIVENIRELEADRQRLGTRRLR